MVRNSLNYVSWKMRAEVAADLKSIFTSATADEAEQRLGEFEAKWDDTYPPISQSWRRNWSLFDYPPEIRKVIYTTNAIESVNMGLRKITKNQGSFPSDDALLKLFYLALSNISQKWTMPVLDWKAALTHFTIQFEDRMTHHYFQLHLHKIPDTLATKSCIAFSEVVTVHRNWTAASPKTKPLIMAGYQVGCARGTGNVALAIGPSSGL